MVRDLDEDHVCYEYMLDAILEFQGKEQGEFFRESLYLFYPTFYKEKMDSLNTEGKKQYISSELIQIYKENELILEDKLKAYKSHWDNNKEIIQQAFEFCKKNEALIRSVMY